jgi:hypothetical protein
MLVPIGRTSFFFFFPRTSWVGGAPSPSIKSHMLHVLYGGLRKRRAEETQTWAICPSIYRQLA